MLAEERLAEGARVGTAHCLPPQHLQQPPGLFRASFVAQGTKPVMGESKRWTTEMKLQLFFGFFRVWGEEDSCSFAAASNHFTADKFV